VEAREEFSRGRWRIFRGRRALEAGSTATSLPRRARLSC
jgi:hypothetical protein